MKASIARHLSWASEEGDYPKTVCAIMLQAVVSTIENGFGRLPLHRAEMMCEQYFTREEFDWQTILESVEELRELGYEVHTELVDPNVYLVHVSWYSK